MVWQCGVFDYVYQLCLVHDPEDINIMRGAHQTGLFSDGCVEAGQQPDQGEKETGAASGIEAGGDTAGAGQPHLVRECKTEGRI